MGGGRGMDSSGFGQGQVLGFLDNVMDLCVP